MTTSERRPVFAYLALALALVAAGVARFWHLAAHDYGNIYYAAAVRSMAESWSNFFFASFDPAGVVTLDKPPAAFWVQVLSVKLLGYNGLALHLPQALMGVINVLLVFVLTRKAAGVWAGVVAAFIMAVFPAAVAADRSNLPDTFLMLVLLIATWALLRAIESRRWTHLLAVAVLVGVGFTAKMIVAWMVLPAFAAAFLVSGPRTIAIRVLRVGAMGVLVLAVSLIWPIAVDLTPAGARPYIGGTKQNSAIERAISGFGLDRLVGRPPGGGPPRGPRPLGPPMGGPMGMPPGPGMRGPAGGASRHLTGHGGMPSVLRLGNRDLAGHGSWLLPFAILGAITAVRVGGMRRDDTRAASLVLWSVWLATFAIVFSAASGPIHPYYLSLLGPPIAALVGIGVIAMLPEQACGAGGGCAVESSVDPPPAPSLGGRGVEVPPAVPSVTRLASESAPLVAARLGRAIAAVVLTMVAQVMILGHTPDWGRIAVPTVLAGGAGSVVLLVIAWVKSCRVTAAAGLSIALIVLLACPAVWSLTPALAGGGRMVPIADPQLLESRHDPDEVIRNRAAIRALVDFLQRGSPNASYLVAAADIHLVAPLIIECGVPAVAYGGFQGNDPAIMLERFKQLVKDGGVRYVLARGGRGPGAMGPPRGRDPIGEWSATNGVQIPPLRWLPRELFAGPPQEMNMMAGDTAGMFRNLYRSGTTALYDVAPCASE